MSPPEVPAGGRQVWQYWGWIGASCFISGAVLLIYFSQNFFDWNPGLQTLTIVAGVMYVAGLVAWIALSLRKIQPPVFTLAAMVSGIMTLVGLIALPEEELDPQRFFGRHESSPTWFRVLMMALLVLPGIVFMVTRLIRSKK